MGIKASKLKSNPWYDSSCTRGDAGARIANMNIETYQHEHVVGWCGNHLHAMFYPHSKRHEADNAATWSKEPRAP